IFTIYNGTNDPIVGKDFKNWVTRKKDLVTVFTILAVTDYEYLTILKDMPRFHRLTIGYKYLTIKKDVPKSNKPTPVSNKQSPETNKDMLKHNKDVLDPNKVEADYEYLTILENAPRPDEISEEVKQINMLRR
ncbi:12232_t:CDS:1, partial [Dentiscutata heterogama]